MLFRSKHGLKLLALPQSSLPGYQIMLRRPLPASGDLQGFKIRGNPTYLSVINMLGASMVTLPVPEVFTSMEKGVIDGFAFPSFGVVSTRLNEVSKFMLRPAMGISTNPLLVNLAAWNRMPAAEQKIFLEESRKAEDRWTAEVDKLIVDEEKELLAKGLQIVQMGDAAKAKLQAAWSEGLLKLAEPKIGPEVAELRKIMKDKGL